MSTDDNDRMVTSGEIPWGGSSFTVERHHGGDTGNSTTLVTGDHPSIDAAAALDDFERFVRSYVVLTPAQSCLTSLWIGATHAVDAFDYAAYLHIHSPLPECGKSRLLEVLEALCRRPWMTGRVTAAVLMRKCDSEQPTLLLDESDAAFNSDETYSEALRGMLNSGFHKSGKATVCVGQGANLTYKDFATFGFKAVAGIGRLPSTVESRSIPIALKRRTRDEPILKWRRRTAWALATTLRQQLEAVIRPALPTLREARPSLPDGLSDRAEDVLEPLFAIADWVGGDWPDRARQAAVELMGQRARVDQESDHYLGLDLLSDIRDAFEDAGDPDKLSTKTIIETLITIEDRPWAAFGKSEKAITPHKVARLLRQFDIRPPKKERDGSETFRGYRYTALVDAWSRYLPLKVEQAEHPRKDGPEWPKTQVERPEPVPHTKIANPADKHCSVPHVPLSPPLYGDRPEQSTPDSPDPTGDWEC